MELFKTSLTLPWRIFFTIIFAATLVYVFILDVLAGVGAEPFTQSTGEASASLFTCLTPAGFNFFFWYLIYFFLLYVVIYAVILVFVKVGEKKAYDLGGPVGVLFMVFLIIALNLNLGWLFAWDSGNLVGSALILLFIVLTTNVALVLSLYSFYKDAAKIYKESLFHFWSGIIAINTAGLYYGFAVVALFSNVVVYFSISLGLGENGLCLGFLIFALIFIIALAIVESTVLIKFSNPLIGHYIAFVWYAIFLTVEQSGLASGAVWALIITFLVVSVVLLVCRICILTFRNWKNPYYKDCQGESCS